MAETEGWGEAALRARHERWARQEAERKAEIAQAHERGRRAGIEEVLALHTWSCDADGFMEDTYDECIPPGDREYVRVGDIRALLAGGEGA